MAKKHKKPIKTAAKKSASGSRSRRKVDPATGRELSHRQFVKKYPPKARTSLQKGYNPNRYRHKVKLYKLIRDDFIEKQKREGVALPRTKSGRVNLTKIQQSDDLKKIIRGLHSKNPIRKANALAATGRITPDQVEFYAQKFSDEGDE